MSEKEYLEQIQKSIGLLFKENHLKEIQMINNMVEFRMSHFTPQFQSLKDIFYFINGILFSKGLSDYWNGREPKCVKVENSEVKNEQRKI